MPALAYEFGAGAFPPANQAQRDFLDAVAKQASEPEKSAETLTRLLTSPDLPADAVRITLAKMVTPEKARPILKELASIKPESPFLPEALELLAKDAEATGDFASEALYLDRLSKVAVREQDKAKALLKLAGVAAMAGLERDTLAAAKRLYIDYAYLEISESAGKYLSGKSGDPDEALTDNELFERGKSFMEKGSREKAVLVFNKLKGRAKKDFAHRVEVDLNLGKALYFLRRYDEALAPLKTAAASKNPSVEQDARFHRARVLFGLDRGNEGAPDLLSLAKKYSGSTKAPLWLYQSYRVFEGRKMTKEAGEARGLLMKKYPTSSEAVDVLWGDGFSAYKNGKFAEAAKILENSVKNVGKGWQQARGIYWTAKALKAAGKEEAAQKALSSLQAKYPLGYYTLLAKSGESGKIPVADPRGKGAMTLSLPSVPQELLNAEGALEKPISYLRLGFYEAARRELENIDAKDERAMWLRYFAEDFDGAARLAGGTWSEWREPAAETGYPDRSRLAYSMAYPYSVNAAALESDIHPHIILAIMKTESNYDPEAYSMWEARGLMQFIPPTASRIAQELGIKDFSQEMLFDPPTATRIGARYLKNLLDLCGGDAACAAASYNAGEAAVKGWREKWAGGGEDHWVESIPYLETRLYVKKVITALDAYDRLSGDGLIILPAGN